MFLKSYGWLDRMQTDIKLQFYINTMAALG